MRICVILTLITIALIPPCYAAEEEETLEQKIAKETNTPKRHVADDRGILSVVWENDVFNGNDRGYTNGGRIAYISPEENMPSYVREASSYLPIPFNREGKKRISFALGQSMFTPRNIATATPPADDRPYAGWLYGSFGLISDSGIVFDNAAITVGVIGSSSKAQQVQKFVHTHITNSPIPQGWNHQLNNELGVNLDYERKWRGIFSSSPFGMAFDVMPHVGAALGNVNTNAAVGFTLRFGYDLPADYGPPRIRPSLPGSDFFIPTKKLGGYLFATFEGRAVGRNIFLDGNTFSSSANVNKRYIVGSLQFGAAVTYSDLRISFTQVAVTSEFKGPYGNSSHFGAITASYRF